MSSEELYVALHARFWQRAREKAYKSVDIALCLHLIDKCYSLNWKTPFYHGNEYICSCIGLSDDKTLRTSRERMINAGEIAFVSGKHRKDLSEYDLLDLSEMQKKGGIFPPLSSKKEGNIPPLPQEKGGNIPPLDQKKGGIFPSLSDAKTAISDELGGKGGKIPDNSDRTIKGAEKSKAENTNTSTPDPLAFEVWWALYDKQVDTKLCKTLWAALSNQNKQKAIEHAPIWVRTWPIKRFRKDPKNYLIGENWNDEELPPADTKAAEPAQHTAAPHSLHEKLKQQRSAPTL